MVIKPKDTINLLNYNSEIENAVCARDYIYKEVTRAIQ
jgi:hypothetical protein